MHGGDGVHGRVAGVQGVFFLLWFCVFFCFFWCFFCVLCFVGGGFRLRPLCVEGDQPTPGKHKRESMSKSTLKADLDRRRRVKFWVADLDKLVEELEAADNGVGWRTARLDHRLEHRERRYRDRVRSRVHLAGLGAHPRCGVAN